MLELRTGSTPSCASAPAMVVVAVRAISKVIAGYWPILRLVRLLGLKNQVRLPLGCTSNSKPGAAVSISSFGRSSVLPALGGLGLALSQRARVSLSFAIGASLWLPYGWRVGCQPYAVVHRGHCKSTAYRGALGAGPAFTRQGP